MQASGSTRSTPLPVAAAPRRYRHSFWWYLKWAFITLQLVLFCAIFITITMLKGVYDEMSKIVPDFRLMMVRNKAEATRIYDAEGRLLAEIKGEQRKWVPFQELKKRKIGKKWDQTTGNLVSATIAAEDSRFYRHPGMDPKRILKAAWENVRSGSSGQGGSTITEQLAVNIYLTRKKTLSRRLQTALLALQLERRFTKDEILEMYLNEIPYGNGAYGCEAAAQTYFGKSAKKLNIAEAAMIAGLPQAPSRLEPFDHFKNAKKRQLVVLSLMLRHGKILPRQYVEAKKDQSLHGKIMRARVRHLQARRDTRHWRAPHFVSYVKQYLRRYGYSDEFLTKSGAKIYTTLDPKLQAAAETVMRKQLRRLSRRGQLQGSLVCIDPWTGHILAMVGGRDYYDPNPEHDGMWNRAVQSKRPPGSTFKPYVYATAMEMGYSPASIVVDKPLKIGKHTIKNYDFVHRGAMTFRSAVGMSNNVAATKVLLKIGIQNVIQKAHLMGIQSPLAPFPSLALGASEVSLLEHVSAYGVFATRGLRAEAIPIDRVQNSLGETLMEHAHPARAARVLSPEAAVKMWDVLRYVVTSGTGKAASIPGVQVIGKTGTTSNNHDVWFMGATPQLACGVWIGYDRPRELRGSSGGKWCAPVWRPFMVSALEVWNKRHPVEKLVEDSRATALQRNIAAQFKKYVRVTVCNESGLLATESCPFTHIEEFSAAGGATGFAPTQHCDIHVSKTRSTRALSEDAGTAPQTRPGDLGYDPAVDADPEAERKSERPARRDYDYDNSDSSSAAPGASRDGSDSPTTYPDDDIISGQDTSDTAPPADSYPRDEGNDD
ncbi:MAG TPA: PBP1A family penicillin-binding protein [Abditibacteriaceae bacterium]|nr:PBP1A family penicillin-binding protein [Abditibacteriaceae bacterium]